MRRASPTVGASYGTRISPNVIFSPTLNTPRNPRAIEAPLPLLAGGFPTAVSAANQYGGSRRVNMTGSVPTDCCFLVGVCRQAMPLFQPY